MVQVEEGEVAIIDEVVDSRASGCRLAVTCGRKPGGVMGIEIPHDNSGIMGVEQKVQVRAELGGA